MWKIAKIKYIYIPAALILSLSLWGNYVLLKKNSVLSEKLLTAENKINLCLDIKKMTEESSYALQLKRHDINTSHDDFIGMLYNNAVCTPSSSSNVGAAGADKGELSAELTGIIAEINRIGRDCQSLAAAVTSAQNLEYKWKEK